MDNRSVLMAVLAGWLVLALFIAGAAWVEHGSAPPRPPTFEERMARLEAASHPQPPKPPPDDFRSRQEALPKLGQCQRIDMKDPAAAAHRNASLGDLRPFTDTGWGRRRAPGIFCPRGDDYLLVSRGGTSSSELSDLCGRTSFSNADPAQMIAYNRTLASRWDFQQMTGCRPATLREERDAQRPQPWF